MGRHALRLEAVALLAAALLAQACAGDTHAVREKALPLTLGSWHKDFLHCEEKECKDFYSLVVSQPGELRVDVYSPAEPGLPDYVLLLESQGLEVLENLPPTGRSPRQIRRPVQPGTYYVRVEAQGNADPRLEYEILAEWREPRAEPPRARTGGGRAKPIAARPKPKADLVDAEVLEVESDRGEPQFVLIDAGTSKGIRGGHAGELIEDGEVIGDIEVVEVYEAGSRARITSPLSDEITIDTRARIAVPRSAR